MLTKEQAIEIIKELIPVIKSYRETKKLKIDFEERVKLKKVFEEYIQPGSLVTITCYPCITHLLDVLESYVGRVFPELMKEEVIESIVEDLAPIEEEVIVKVVNKGGRPRKVK